MRVVPARCALLGAAALVLAACTPGASASSSGTPSVAAPASSATASSAAPAPSATASAPAPTPVFDTAAHSTTDPASPWVVVNKQHPIQPLDYAPADLVTVQGRPVSADVAPDLTALLAAAQADGARLTMISGYRSYAYQRGVHARSVARQGAAAADRVSARAGFSEHQTGLAVDLGSSTRPACDLRPCFATTVEGQWLDAHAGQFGFLHRYTDADSTVTGYDPEGWHYRWVGRDLAAEMARDGVPTLEQFFGVSGGPVYVG